jgi:trimeric autotransporter adhesin
MKTKILSGLICCLGIFSANAQTITAPVGTPLTITNAVDVTGGGLNILTDNEYKIGGKKVISNKGTYNLFLGEGSGQAIAAGVNNSFLGAFSGLSTTSGSNSVFMGVNSGYSNTTGTNNYFIGVSAGYGNTSGNNNTFLGKQAGFSNTTANGNMFLGTNAGYSTTTGSDNSFFGTDAGYTNTTGSSNMFFGVSAGVSNTTGSNNYFAGVAAGVINTTGSRNIMIGGSAGALNTTGTDNTYIGYGSGGTAVLTNATAIGANATVTTPSTIVLGNAATTVTGAGLGAGLSGLRFANITSASPAGVGGANKALSVDAAGNVILVGIVGATTTATGGPVAENWKESDGYLYNNSTNGVVIKGTGLDGNSLIVKGGVLSKEVNVKVEGSEAWPDYVFKPNYKRMTLGEVEKFISINGHLPNVPSATEMAATGNNLGKTDVKLLEKVEELTLYLLDMKKANDAQAAELKALKQQVSKLRKK